MRALFDELRSRVEGFVEQRSTLCMLVTAGPREYVALVKTLEGIEQGSTPHLVLLWSEEFAGAEPYMNVWAAAFREQHEALRAQLASHGRQLPELPAALFERGQSAHLRLRALCMAARSWLPDLTAARLVVALVPHTIRDRAAYATFVQSALEHELPAPWCHHMRFVVRDDAAQPAFEGSQALPHAQRYAPDLSDARVVQALEDEANASEVSVPQRMQSLLILAGMDSAHGRTDAALEKYELVAKFHAALGDQPALAVALNGMGEACLLAQRFDDAQRHLERALTPALAAKDLPSLLPITFNLARLHQARRAWQLACDHYDALSTLARASLNAALQLTCHEQRGLCWLELGAPERALDEWRAGVTLAKGASVPEQELSFLRRMHRLLGSQRRTREALELETRMRELRAQGTEELPL